MAQQAGLDAEVRSAGVAAMDGAPMSENSCIVLENKGIPCEHQSRMLRAEDVQWANLVLTMTMGHKRAVIGQFPDSIEKVYTLKEYALDDPDVRAMIEQREELVARLQLSMALNEPIDEADKQKLMELELQIPEFDISDPFGGSLERYEECAVEIEQELKRIIERLKNGQLPDKPFND